MIGSSLGMPFLIWITGPAATYPDHQTQTNLAAGNPVCLLARPYHIAASSRTQYEYRRSQKWNRFHEDMAVWESDCLADRHDTVHRPNTNYQSLGLGRN